MTTEPDDDERESVSIIGLALLLAALGLFAHSMGWLEDTGLQPWQLWPLVPVVIGARGLARTEGIARVFSLLFVLCGVVALAFNLKLLTPGLFGALEVEQWNPSLVWALLLAVAGMVFLLGGSSLFIGIKRVEGRRLRQLSLFGGQGVSVTTERFTGGWIAAIFGGFEVDLTECQPAAPVMRLEVLALFGGGEVHVPTGWRVELSGLPVFGGFGSTAKLDPELADGAPVLRINGVVLFGGFEVNNGG